MPASRSSRSSRSRFANSSGIRPANSSSSASASSRSASRTLTRRPGPAQQLGQGVARAARRRRGRGCTPRTGRAGGASSPLCCAAAATVSTSPAVGAELAALRPHRSDQAGRGILGPRVVHDDRRAAQLAQPPSDAGTEERALADATRAVEDGEPAREHVRRHRRDLALTAEEEERVELGVLERGEALVRALRDGASSSRRLLQRALELGDVRRRRHVDHLDVAAPPELALERLRPGVHRPRAVRQRLARPRAARARRAASRSRACSRAAAGASGAAAPRAPRAAAARRRRSG